MIKCTYIDILFPCNNLRKCNVNPAIEKFGIPIPRVDMREVLNNIRIVKYARKYIKQLTVLE